MSTVHSTELCYLLTGSNLGNREQLLRRAAELIGERMGRISRLSPVYSSEPWGLQDQPEFLNQAIELHTDLRPRELLQCIAIIEAEIGRSPGRRWGAREIDVDILLYGNLVLDEIGLRLPHPRLTERRFALLPLSQLAPDALHPVLGQTTAQLLSACPDPLRVKLHSPCTTGSLP